jgi:hypothetical protein
MTSNNNHSRVKLLEEDPGEGEGEGEDREISNSINNQGILNKAMEEEKVEMVHVIKVRSFFLSN